MSDLGEVLEAAFVRNTLHELLRQTSQPSLCDTGHGRVFLSGQKLRRELVTGFENSNLSTVAKPFDLFFLSAFVGEARSTGKRAEVVCRMCKHAKLCRLIQTYLVSSALLLVALRGSGTLASLHTSEATLWTGVVECKYRDHRSLSSLCLPRLAGRK